MSAPGRQTTSGRPFSRRSEAIPERQRDGTIQAGSTDVDEDLDAEATTVAAIGLIGGAQVDETVPITVQGQLTDGTPFSLEHDVRVRE